MVGTADTEECATDGLDFSVVVPTKGRPRELEGCLAALAVSALPGDRFEVIIVNDGGGRAVAKLAERFGARLAMPSGTGPSAARNAGARAARGRWIAFTDDDCEPDAEWLPALRRALAAHPGAAVGGPTVNAMLDDRGAVATQAVVDALHEQANRGPGPPRFFDSSNLAAPRREFLASGGFDEGFRYAEDRELCERWIRSGRRLIAAPDAVVRHLRTLTVRQFAGQHFGYGRGAFAFRRRWPAADGDTAGVLRALARRALRPEPGAPRPSAPYLMLSQIATAAGFAREAIGVRVHGFRAGH